MEIEGVVVEIIREMAKIPAALKAWKTPVAELLADNRLFNSSPEVAVQWKPIVKALYEADRSAFPELLGRLNIQPRRYVATDSNYLQRKLYRPRRRISLQIKNTRCCYAR